MSQICWTHAPQILRYAQDLVRTYGESPDSLYCAIEQESCILTLHQRDGYLIKGTPNLDFTSLPHWMRSAHFYDLAPEEDDTYFTSNHSENSSSKKLFPVVYYLKWNSCTIPCEMDRSEERRVGKEC